MKNFILFLLLFISQALLSGTVFSCYYTNGDNIEEPFPISISRDLNSLKKEPLLPDQLKNNWEIKKLVKFYKSEDIYVGKLSGREVYEIKYYYDRDTTGYTESYSRCEAIQMIYIENEKGMFSPIFIGRCIYGGSVGWIEPTVIDIVEGKEILTTSYAWHGTGYQFSDFHFMYDKDDLHLMKIYEIINEDFNKILPKNYGVWKGGYFSIKNLKVGSYLWKKTDSNSNPSGGGIEIWYKLDGYSIKRIKYKIDYEME